LAAFFIQYFWYDSVTGRGLLSVFNHDDFKEYLPNGFVPSPFFSLSFLSEVLGAFFLLGYFFSLLLSFLHRKAFSKILVFDLICLAIIIGVVGLNTYLVLGNNMLVPYVNSIKYDYLTLPMFCLLAASSAKKFSLLSKQKSASGKNGVLIIYVATLGLYLLLISMIFNLMTINRLSNYEWFTFKVEGGFSYSFDRLSPILDSAYLWAVQFFGFILIQFSLLWANRGRIESLFASL
jgi:hypothetical protein